jgi:hypothetical protein
MVKGFVAVQVLLIASVVVAEKPTKGEKGLIGQKQEVTSDVKKRLEARRQATLSGKPPLEKSGTPGELRKLVKNEGAGKKQKKQKEGKPGRDLKMGKFQQRLSVGWILISRLTQLTSSPFVNRQRERKRKVRKGQEEQEGHDDGKQETLR